MASPIAYFQKQQSFFRLGIDVHVDFPANTNDASSCCNGYELPGEKLTRDANET